jgi:two-component system chemotaxis sensor kinase CheA
MHMMRNAIDHGIEARAAREAVGKPAVGTIALNAFQKGNHVVIEIEDDGAGIDTDGLLEAALKRGFIAPEDARTTSRRDILNLVFAPGVTTKQDVTELSGRGVGMDVVKTNIGKLGGVIDLQSESGIGTKVTVTLPITLAIISALIVDVADRRFAIPLSNVQEAVVLDLNEIKKIEGRDVITLRGATLQLCWLSRLFDLERRDESLPPSSDSPSSHGSSLGLGHSAGTGPKPGSLLRIRTGLSGITSGTGHTARRRYIVVTSVGVRRLGLVVDALHGEQDVVIKALGSSLRNVRGFAGATELGDQRVGLVIDAPALLEEMLATSERRAEQGGSRG